MTVAWKDLTSDDYGVGAPIAQPLWGSLEENDEAGLDHVFQVAIPTVSMQNTAYATLWTFSRVLGQGAKKLKIGFFGYCINGPGPSLFKCTLNGTLDSDIRSLDAANNGSVINCTFSDVIAYRGQLVTIEIKARSNLVTETTQLESFDSAICLESWD